jgi:SAM-dependent methyltransferase
VSFDQKYGLDTSGFIPLSALDVTAESWVFGGAYQAVGADVDFGSVLANLALPYEQFTFIDLGSGKGRAVLLASTLPFRKVVGVEFSQALHQVAEENLRRWPEGARKCRQIVLECMDAREYRLPDESFVLFLYNPFGPPIMEQVIANVRAAHARSPGRIVVLYFTPKHAALWDRVEFLTKAQTGPGYSIYDTGRG